MAKSSKVTAFELDGSVVGDVDAHPFVFGGFPGRWQVGRPTLPEALGLTVTRMRELIKQFNLPLVEVQVNEKDAFTDFPEDPQRILAGPQVVEPPSKQPEMLEVHGSKIPGPTPPGSHPELQPFAAEQIAAATRRLHPDAEPEAIVDTLEVEPDSEAATAALEAAGTEGETS